MLKQSTVAVPDLIARVMTGFPVERVESWRPKARERTREALETAKKTTVMNLPEQPVIEEEVE